MEVLIVEREPVIAHALTSVLTSRGHGLRVATSAEDALALPRPDVLVTEQHLGAISGLDLLRELGRPGPPPRTVIVTSTPSLEDCRRAMRLGAREYLSKPFRLEDLVRAIEEPDPRTAESFHSSYLTRDNLIAHCGRDLGSFALQHGVGPSCRARIATAVSELLENAIEHAYPEGEGRVTVEAIVDGREVMVTVSDEGRGFRPRKISAEHLSSPKHDGLARAAALAEGMKIESQPGQGARITLRFDAYRVDFDEGDMVDLTELDFLAPTTSRQILRTLEDEDGADLFQLSPALAVVIGRFLSGTDPEKVVPQVLWS